MTPIRIDDDDDYKNNGNPIPARKRNLRRQDTERFGALEDSALLYRIEKLEDEQHELENFSDELRLGQNTRIAQIKQLEDIVSRHETELVLSRTQVTEVATDVNKRIDDTRAAQTNYTAEVNKRIDELRTTMTDKIESVRVVLTDKVDATERSLVSEMGNAKQYNSRWFIGILATLLTSVLLLVLTNLEIFH